MIKNLNITKVVIIITTLIALVNAGANINLDSMNINILTKEDFERGVTVTGRNTGCCSGNIKAISFSSSNSPFSIEGIELPYVVDPGAEFSFKIIYNQNSIADRENKVDTLVVELDFQFMRYYAINYTPDVTPVVDLSTKKNLSVSYSIKQGKLNFQFQKSGNFSANLISANGKVVAIIADRVNVTAGNGFISNLNMSNFSSGNYLLKTSFKGGGEDNSFVQKLNYLKN